MYNGKRWTCELVVVIAGNKVAGRVTLDWSPGFFFCPHTFKKK